MTFGNHFAIFTLIFTSIWMLLTFKNNFWICDKDLIEEGLILLIPVFFPLLFIYLMVVGTVYGLLGKW